MSHHIVKQSPPGTPLRDRTVGELVAEKPSRSRVFQAYKIDFCCQGGRSLREACEHKNVPLETVVERIEELDAVPVANDVNPSMLSPKELAQYIIDTHHAFLREELPRIHAMAVRVARAHGGHTPSVIELAEVVDALCRELDTHITREENDLVPAIAALSMGEKTPESLDSILDDLANLHEETSEALHAIRQLTNDFQPPAQACNTWRALFSGLADLDDDLHRHIHLENNVLFPAVEKLAEQAA